MKTNFDSEQNSKNKTNIEYSDFLEDGYGNRFTVIIDQMGQVELRGVKQDGPRLEDVQWTVTYG